MGFAVVSSVAGLLLELIPSCQDFPWFSSTCNDILLRGGSQILKSFSWLHSPLQGGEEDQEGNYTNITMAVLIGNISKDKVKHMS